VSAVLQRGSTLHGLLLLLLLLLRHIVWECVLGLVVSLPWFDLGQFCTHYSSIPFVWSLALMNVGFCFWSSLMEMLYALGYTIAAHAS
jgi:hypothetical protein